MAIDPIIFGQFLTALTDAPTRGDRAALLDNYAGRFGLTIAALRRQAKAAGFDFGYAKRRDAGTARREDLAAGSAQVVKLILASGGRLPSFVAIDHAKAIGWIASDLDLSASYVDRYIREHHIRREPSSAPRQTRLCKWGDPGDVLQIDSTNCAQWFFVEASGSIRRTKTGEVYHNKPARIGSHILRYVATDPASGLFRIRYFQVDGETAETALEFLHWSMCRTPDPDKLPMAGVPKRLVLDGGSGNKSSAFANACEMLGIELCPHLPHHAWAKGSVEQAMDQWEEEFESRLAIWPANDLADLNAKAYAYNVYFCAERLHTRHGMTRSAFYAQHCLALQMPPAWGVLVEAAHTRPENRRVVGGQLISFEGDSYYVGGLAGCGTGDSVTVCKAILDWDDATRPVRIEFRGQTIVEHRLTKDDRGNFTDQRVYQARNDEAIEAEEALPAIHLAEAREAHAPMYDVASAPSVAVPAARMHVAQASAGPSYRRLMAKSELVARLGRELSQGESDSLHWAETVTRAQIEETIARLTPSVPEIRRQAGIA